MTRALAAACLLAAACRTQPNPPWDFATAFLDGSGASDASPAGDLARFGTVLFGANDTGTPVGAACSLQGETVGRYAFVVVPTGNGRIERVDLFASDPLKRTYGLAVYAGGGGGVPGQVLARGTLAPDATPSWTAAWLDRPVPVGGVLWIGDSGDAPWQFRCPFAVDGFGFSTDVGGPGTWTRLGEERWMFRLIGEAP